MKKEFLKRVKMLVVPAALAIAMAAFGPTAALAQGHGGGRGHGGGHSYSGGHTYSGGHGYSGHSFSGSAHSNFRVGRPYSGRSYYGGGFNGARGYYSPGFGVGIYAAPGYGYEYSAPVCNPTGFYDQRGFWHYYPGCVASPYDY